jgi:hypothetical protein
MPAPQVAMVGMRALRRDIRQLAEDEQSALYAAIKQAGKDAAEPVAARARSAIPSRTGRLAGTVRTSGTKTGATVRMGYKSVPYGGWLEFGGTRPDGSSREYIATGRYLFPAASGLAPVSADLYARALSRVFSSSSSWTNTTNDPGAVHD